MYRLNHIWVVPPRSHRASCPHALRKSPEAAFTLLEVLIAVAILSVALMTFMASMANNVELTQMNSETNIALNAITEAKEGIGALSYGDLTTDLMSATFAASGLGRDDKTIVLTNSSGSGQVGRMALRENESGDLKTVELSITWRSITGSDRTIRLLVECANY